MDNKKINEALSNSARYYFFIIKKLQSLPKDKKYTLLDVGSGEKILKKLVPKNIKYYSLDFEGDCDYVVDLDKGKLPIKSKTFDIIICTETLEHVIYPHKVMEELLRIAKPNALFILSMPNELNFYIRLQYLLNKKPKVQTPFQTILKHGHIHTPRTKDVSDFFSNYVDIQETYYSWYSRTGFMTQGITKKFIRALDSIINMLSKISPSLFARNVTVIGKRKT